jgi:transcriptional regulator with XRE-family HTH domain
MERDSNTRSSRPPPGVTPEGVTPKAGKRIAMMRNAELIRIQLGMTPSDFARQLGVTPQRYQAMLEGGYPQHNRLVRLAANGLAHMHRLDSNHAFLFRVVDGVPIATMLDRLHAKVIDGISYLLVPLAQVSDGPEEPPLPGGYSWPNRETLAPPAQASRHEQIVDAVAAVLADGANGEPALAPAQILDRLDGDAELAACDLFDRVHRTRRQQLAALSVVLWQEARRPQNRISRPARGHYALSPAELVRHVRPIAPADHGRAPFPSPAGGATRSSRPPDGPSSGR